MTKLSIARNHRAWHRLPVAVAATLAVLLTGGKPSPVDTVSVLDSLTGDSTIINGNVVYVDFWASWCVPCRRSFPWMAEMLDRYKDQGLQVVTINVDHDPEAARKFLDATHSTLPVVRDPEGNLAKLYDLNVMPTSFVYGRDGHLKSRREGFHLEETGKTEALIRSLLQEKKTP